MTRDSTPWGGGTGQASKVIANYLEALDRGETPDRQELLRQHPDLAPELEDFFADQDRIDRLARSMADPRGVLPVSATGPHPASAPTPALGEEKRSFGDYEIEAELGRGGMGVVYKARQVSLNRTVALKMILAGEFASPAELQRFRREAELVAPLEHPHIVPVFELGVHEGQAYLTMKLVEGESLEEALAGGRWPVGGREAQKRTAGLLRDVARAVHHAHQCGVLHRDLKPANVLLDQQGEPHVTDFGLARRLSGGTRLTQTGVIVGTLRYMAPEQASDGKNITTAADVYSLGAILYELLTGRPPFQGDTPLDVLRQIREHEPPRPRSLDRRIDRDLEAICLKCLEKEPNRRYASVEALAEDLERWLRGELIQSRSIGLMRRLVRRMRRQPAVTALLSLAVLISLVCGSAMLWQWHRDARARRELVPLIENERKRRAYLDAVRAAASKLGPEDMHGVPARKDTKRARELLDSCPRELRALEWYCLNGLCNGLHVGRQAPGFYEYLGPVPDPEIYDDGKHRQPYEFVLGKNSFVAFSPDGRSIAVPTKEALIIRDRTSGEERLRLPPPVFGQWCFRPQRAIMPWESNIPRQADPFVNQQAHLPGSVAFDPDEKSLYVAAEDGVRVLDAATGTELRRLTGAPVPEFFSPDGKRYCSTNQDQSIVLYDVFSGHKLMFLRQHVFLGFGRDGRRFAVCQLSGAVRIYDSASCERIITLPGVKVKWPCDHVIATITSGMVIGGLKARDYYNLSRSICLVDGKCLAWFDENQQVKICDLTPSRD